MIGEVLTQAIYYLVVMVLAVTLVGFMQRGFFWQFIQVKLSFGKKILVELRSIPNYQYRVGYTEGGILKFKDKREGRKFTNRVPVPAGKNIFYKSMGCWRVDVDPEKNCLLEPNLVGIQSYDPQRFDELMSAAIEAQAPNLEKIILIALIITAIAVGVGLFLNYQNGEILAEVANTCKQQIGQIPPPANI